MTVLDNNELSVGGRRWRFPGPFALLTGFAISVFSFLIIYAVGRMLWRTFVVDGQLQFSAAVDILSEPWLPQVLLNTLVVVGVSTIFAVALGAILAWINERTDASFGALGLILPIIPLLLPGVAVAIGWVFLAAPRVGFINGWLASLPQPLNLFQINVNTWGGLIFVYTLNGIPFVYLVLSAAFKNLDPALEEASRISGGSLWRTLRKVSLPAIMPAMLASTLLVVINGLGTYSTAVIIATPARVDLLTTRIVEMLTRDYPPNLVGAQVLSFILLLAVGVIWMIQSRVGTKGQFVTVGGRAAGGQLIMLGKWRWVARGFTSLVIVVTTVMPALALLLVSVLPYWTPNIDWNALTLNNYNEAIFVNRLTGEAFRNSLMLSGAGATIAMAIAILSAIYIGFRNDLLAVGLDFFLKVPAVLPHLIIAVGFLISFGGAPFYLSGTALILLLAMVVIYISPGAIAATAAVSQVGKDLREASRISGAGEGRTILRILLPLALPGFLAGWTLVFVQMMGDLSVAALLAGLRTPVIGFAMLEIWEAGGVSVLAAFATVLCVVNLLVVGTMMFFVRTRRKRVSR